MTKFCLEQERTEAWFDMEGGGRVHYQLPTADDLKTIRKQSVKKKVEFKRVDGKAERFEYEEGDADLQNELFWDMAIIEWEKLFDSKGSLIECTKPNKILLLSKSQRFLEFSNNSLKRLQELEKERIEEAEKNS